MTETLTEDQRLKEAEGLNINATPWTGLQNTSWGRSPAAGPVASPHTPIGSPASTFHTGAGSYRRHQGGAGGVGIGGSGNHGEDSDFNSSPKDSRPMCKYFAMGGCNRTDCPFSHELTVEATSHSEAASGFVLSGNVANIRNARAGSPKEVYGGRSPGVESDSHHSPYMSWNNSSPTIPGMGSHGTQSSGSHGAGGFEDNHQPSSRANSTGGPGFSGNMGNDSQMLSLLLGGGPGATGPSAAPAGGANPRVGTATGGDGGATGASTVSNSSFDVATINRPAEFTPYPSPNAMSQHSANSHSHSHNHSSHSGNHAGYGHHGRGHGMSHHSNHSQHEDFLSSGELQQRYLTNNNVAALFGTPAPNMLSSTSNGNPALSALLGQAPTSFTAYPATKPGAAFPALGSSAGSSNQAGLQDAVHLPGNGSLTAIPGGAGAITLGGSTTSDIAMAAHNSTVSPVVGPMHAPSSSTSSTSGTAGGYNPFSGVSPTIMPMAAPNVQLPPAPTMTALASTVVPSSVAVAAAPPAQPQPHAQPQVAPTAQHSAVQHNTPAVSTGPTAAEKLHTPRTQPSGLPIPSADLFPPLPSTAPTTSGVATTVKHEPPVVYHAPHSYIAKLTGAGRSSTPPSEGIGASAPLGTDPSKERVPKVPVSIDDEMSALQSMHYRSPDGAKESPSAPGKREDGPEHPPTRVEAPASRERGMGAPRGGKDYRSVVAATSSNTQVRPDREKEKEREPAPRPDIPAPKSASARGGANIGGRGQGHDRGGYQRRQNDAPTNAPVPL